MKKLKLKPKEEITISIETERTDEYPYLRFYRKNEHISRIDRYVILMCFDDIDEMGNEIRREEVLFYPSEYGMNLIAEMDAEFGVNEERVKKFKRKVEALKKYGDCWWSYDYNEMLTPDNWISHKYPKFKPKKLELKPKKEIKRMQLKCQK
jgi:hypothetical protein